MASSEQLSVGDRRYLDLLRKVILGAHNPEAGLRTMYLLECLNASPSPRAKPQTFDAEYFANIADHRPRAWQGILDDHPGFGWERILGFPHSMLGQDRLDDVERAILTCHRESIPGDFLETGVWRGGVGIFARALYQVLDDTSRTVWMADSFQGLPAPDLDKNDPDDLEDNWVLSASLATVKRNFSHYGLLDEQVRFIEGWFADTMPTAPIHQLSVLRLDGDYYSSTMDVLETMFPKVSPGGFVLIDDYGAYEACRNAIHDYNARIGINPEITTSDWTGAWFRKP